MIFLSRTETTDRVSSRLSPQNASDCGGLQTIMGYLSMYPSASSPAGFRKSQLTLRVFLVARRIFSFEETPRTEPIFGYRKEVRPWQSGHCPAQSWEGSCSEPGVIENERSNGAAVSQHSTRGRLRLLQTAPFSTRVAIARPLLPPQLAESACGDLELKSRR